MPTKLAKNDYVTHQDLEIFGEKLHKQIVEDLSGVIQQFAQHVDDRFNQLEVRVDKLEASIDRLTNTIDGFVKRLDDIEADNTARDAQLARLERWIEQVAKKTGVKLEY